MGKIEVDVSAQPLVVVRIPEEYDFDDIEACESSLVQAFAALGDGSFMLLAQINLTRSDAKRRTRWAALLKTISPQLESRCRGFASAIPSTVVRAAIKAVFWIFSPPCPTQVFGTAEEARAWLASL